MYNTAFCHRNVIRFISFWLVARRRCRRQNKCHFLVNPL